MADKKRRRSVSEPRAASSTMPVSEPRAASSTMPDSKKQKLPPIFTLIFWGLEHEFNGLRVCNNKEFVNKIKPIFKAFCDKTQCKLNVTTEQHTNNEYDIKDTKDNCFYLEAQIGVMEGFNYTLFEKCCDEFKKFIKCVSRIDDEDELYVTIVDID